MNDQGERDRGKGVSRLVIPDRRTARKSCSTASQTSSSIGVACKKLAEGSSKTGRANFSRPRSYSYFPYSSAKVKHQYPSRLPLQMPKPASDEAGRLKTCYASENHFRGRTVVLRIFPGIALKGARIICQPAVLLSRPPFSLFVRYAYYDRNQEVIECANERK